MSRRYQGENVGGVRTRGRDTPNARPAGLHYRVLATYFDRDSTYETNPGTSDDGRLGRIGFRADWSANERDTVTVQGDAYRGNTGHLSPSVTIIGRAGPRGEIQRGVYAKVSWGF